MEAPKTSPRAEERGEPEGTNNRGPEKWIWQDDSQRASMGSEAS